MSCGINALIDLHDCGIVHVPVHIVISVLVVNHV